MQVHVLMRPEMDAHSLWTHNVGSIARKIRQTIDEAQEWKKTRRKKHHVGLDDPYGGADSCSSDRNEDN